MHGLAEQFGKARVGLNELGDFGDGGFPVHGEIAAAQLFGDPRAHHVHTEDLTGGAVGMEGATNAAGGNDTMTEQLERLASLHTSGQLSDEEFAAAKAMLLSGGSAG